MFRRIVPLAATALLAALAGCSSVSLDPAQPTAPVASPAVETTGDATSTAATLSGYKYDLASRIAQTSPVQVFVGRPQALLRSVVVVKYQVDASGRLMRSEILRSNRDRVTETAALASLRKAAPFPKPAAHLLRHGRVEILETWLFNNDGRFQLRSIAEPQMAE